MTTWMREIPIPDEDPREAKLPVWARDVLRACRRAATEAQAAARDARLSTNPDESRAVMDLHGDVPVGLGEHPDVSFMVPGRHRADSYISVRHDRQHPERLRIMGAESVMIRLDSSNTFTVELDTDR